jgi:hypothetical protein
MIAMGMSVIPQPLSEASIAIASRHALRIAGKKKKDV